MDLDGQPNGMPGQWPTADMDYNQPATPPAVKSPNTKRPNDPREFYAQFSSPTAEDLEEPHHIAPPQHGRRTPRTVHPITSRSISRSPNRLQQKPASGPTGPRHRTLNNARSNPVMLPSRQSGTVKDIANKIDQGAAAAENRQPPPKVNTNRDRFRQPVSTSRNVVQPTLNTSSGDARSGASKLAKRKPGPRSPKKMQSPATSFETTSSMSSTGTAMTTQSQPVSTAGSRKPPYVSSKPLFGEITSDGRWNGNFEISNYAPLPAFSSARRGSEGNYGSTHVRSQSHQDFSQSALNWQANYKLNHMRSRSDMDAVDPQATPPVPSLETQETPKLEPIPAGSNQRLTPPPSRIPVSNRRQSSDSGGGSHPQSRSASALSNRSARTKPSNSTTHNQPTTSRANTPHSTARNRYKPPTITPPQSNQTLSAKIVAPLPKTSPPLRSSRPRQPVSSATTSASRARAAERFQGSANAGPKDVRRPSEQWLGKPYDPQKEQSKRRIPELSKINFEERRARIQKAISQNLESTRFEEALKRQSRIDSRDESEVVLHESYPRPSDDAEAGAENEHDKHQAELLDRETDQLSQSRHATPKIGYSRKLSVDTAVVARPNPQESEPTTAVTDQTVFEDESPIIGKAPQLPMVEKPRSSEQPILLTPARYQPPSKAHVPPAIRIPDEMPRDSEQLASPSVLENVMLMRQRSASSMSVGDGEQSGQRTSAVERAREPETQWSPSGGISRDHGSIKIMLDDDQHFAHQMQQTSQPRPDSGVNPFNYEHSYEEELAQARQWNRQAFNPNGLMDTSIDHKQASPEEAAQVTPRKRQGRESISTPTRYSPSSQRNQPADSAPDSAVSRMLDHYQSTGTITPQMYQDMQNHMIDLHRLSANGGSNAIMVQNLLDSILDEQSLRIAQEQQDGRPTQEPPRLQPHIANLPPVTPDTPLLEDFTPGEVLVYGQQPQGDEEEDFEAKIRRADEEWERQQRGGGEMDIPEQESQHPPTAPPPPPPPKDFGYTPRTNSGPNSATFPQQDMSGLRISTLDALDTADLQERSAQVGGFLDEHNDPSFSPTPPHPTSFPPEPPVSASLAPSVTNESGRASSELFPPQPWRESASSRPSIDSERVQPAAPASQSMTSITDSSRQGSFEAGADGQPQLLSTAAAGPEQKRLLRRRHIIKELLDTENTYHQDLKIIEDIYKATCSTDVVQPEDKKVLFGNCDEIERFALYFYDELRKAVNSIYVPSRGQRYPGRRNSESTTQSDGTNPNNPTDNPDDEKDRNSTIGKCFLANLSQMEQIYGAYLKNHDAANKRLYAIQDIETVKCWLAECHANASDITSAWDLDSLLVKPTQRVAKYPMLLQQLLETTPQDHPDHGDLKTAAISLVEMLTRINEAKKRADLVDSIINRKRKDSDMRSGIAKAFGRRTEKLKERVGIAEAYQDPEFEELAHKFGGHFIRLQICMRDVQDYVNRTRNAVELINNYATALELYTDVQPSQLPEIEAKWRKYGQVVRDLTVVAFAEHKAAVQRRVLTPMVQCIKFHEGPQNAINKRKKRILDYAKVKSDERRGQKPDKKTAEAAEVYVALNDQLKLELPKLYNLTGSLVQHCLYCFVDIQQQWHDTWQRKLRPLLEAADIPKSIEEIEPAFRPDFMDAEARCLRLAICNGSLKAESSGLMSPQTTLVDSSDTSSGKQRTSTLDGSRRGASVDSELSGTPHRRHSGAFSPPDAPGDNRNRSNSSMSTRPAPLQTPSSNFNRPWSNSATSTPFSASRPGTATTPSGMPGSYSMARTSSENPRSPPRPGSGATFYTARPDQDNTVTRFSGIFTSALPPDTSQPSSADPTRAPSPQQATGEPTVLFVCASLFEFSIDRTRREGGYPYLTYVQGEVFDVIAQKGELWLAKNQDDRENTLGWIWEQHFIILSAGD